MISACAILWVEWPSAFTFLSNFHDFNDVKFSKFHGFNHLIICLKYWFDDSMVFVSTFIYADFHVFRNNSFRVFRFFFFFFFFFFFANDWILGERPPSAIAPSVSDGQIPSNSDDCALAWSSHLSRNDSPIVRLMQGQLRSSLTCASENCGKTSLSYDPFMVLSLPLPVPPTPPEQGRQFLVRFFPANDRCGRYDWLQRVSSHFNQQVITAEALLSANFSEHFSKIDAPASVNIAPVMLSIWLPTVEVLTSRLLQLLSKMANEYIDSVSVLNTSPNKYPVTPASLLLIEVFQNAVYKVFKATDDYAGQNNIYDGDELAIFEVCFLFWSDGLYPSKTYYWK